jgi:rubrerythrin
MQLIAMDPRIDQPNLKRILVWIVEDEERHELILTRIRALTTTPKEE